MVSSPLVPGLSGDPLLQRYREYLRVVEEEFDVNWLKLFEKAPNQEIPNAWSRAKREFEQAELIGAFALTPPTLELLEVGAALSRARECPGYDAIRARLRKDYVAARFEAHVAALGTEWHFDVAFVPTDAGRTPDMRLTRDDADIFVECTRRKPFAAPVSRTDPLWGELDRHVSDGVKPGEFGFNVVVGTLGALHAADVERIARAVKHALTDGLVGFIPAPVGSLVYIARNHQDAMVGDKTSGLMVGPLYQDQLDAVRQVSTHTLLTLVDEDHIRKEATISLAHWIVDVNTVRHIVDRLRAKRKRGQIPPDSRGAIYLECDSSRVRSMDEDIYERLVTETLKREVESDDESGPVDVMSVIGRRTGLRSSPPWRPPTPQERMFVRRSTTALGALRLPGEGVPN